MTNLDYNAMSTEALEVLLEDANYVEDHAKIEQILINRELSGEDEDFEGFDDDLADGDIEEDDEQEEEDDAQEEAKEEAEAIEAEQRAEKLEIMQEFIGKEAEVFNVQELEWVPGYVSGILNDKRAKNPMYSVKLTDGSTVRRAFGSNQIKIGENQHPDYKKVVAKAKEKTAAKREKVTLTQLEVETIKLQMTANLGQQFEHEDYGTCTIVGVTHDKRHDTLMYRTSSEGGKKFNITYNNPAITAGFIGLDEEVHERNIARIEYAIEALTNPNFICEALAREIAEVEAQIEKLRERKEVLAEQLEKAEQAEQAEQAQ